MSDEDTSLVLAAGAAAGLEVGVIHQRPHRRCAEGWTPWNPLESDADAFRLAVALSLTIVPQPMRSGVYVDSVSFSRFEEWGQDRDAATRRAIVRAAAALKDTA